MGNEDGTRVGEGKNGRKKTGMLKTEGDNKDKERNGTGKRGKGEYRRDRAKRGRRNVKRREGE